MPNPDIWGVKERERITALHEYRILDSAREELYDDIVDDLANKLGVTYAGLMFFDESRVWFKAMYGQYLNEMPRPAAMATLLLTEKLDHLNIPDTKKDDRCARFYSVGGPLQLRSLLVVPVLGENSILLGAVMVGDASPRVYDQADLRTLLLKAGDISDQLVTRREENRAQVALAGTASNFLLIQSMIDVTRTVVSELAFEMMHDFGWWAVQPWLHYEGSIIPSEWSTAPHTPTAMKLLEGKLFSASPVPFSGKEYWVPALLRLNDLPWIPNSTMLRKVGVRHLVVLDLFNDKEVSIRMLFVVPSVNSLSADAKKVLNIALSLIPKILVRDLGRARTLYTSKHDDLTGLNNRRGFDEVIETSGSNPKLVRAILFLDLDGFKQINDQYGHLLGDEYLKHVANILEATVRPVDVVARLGGDEFVILTADSDKNGELESIAKRIVEALDVPYVYSNGAALRCKISIGGAYWPAARTFEQSLSEADSRMYAVKKSGGGVNLEPPEVFDAFLKTAATAGPKAKPKPEV